MLCQKCQKNIANVNVVRNINGQITELHLCSECAAGENIAFPSFSGNELFSAFFKDFTPQPESDEPRCPTCSMTYRKLKEQGKFGCNDCFTAFEKYLDSMLKSVQGNNRHTGKLPRKTEGPLKRQRELEELKYQLRKAIEEEHFEYAAQLRDQIKEMEKGDGQHD